MSLTLEQIMNEANKIAKGFPDELEKKFAEGKDQFDSSIKAIEYLRSFSLKHPGDFDLAVGLEAVKLAIEKLEPDKEKAKEVFLEYKLNAYGDYKKPVPKNKLERQITNVLSATKVVDIKKSLNELDIPFKEYHKTHILNLFKELQRRKKEIYEVFKNNETDQYPASILTLTIYVELLLTISISYRFGNQMKIKDDKIKDYLTNNITNAPQRNRIKIAKKIGLLDNELFKRLKTFNGNRNKYIHESHLTEEGTYPLKLYYDGRKIINSLEEIIIENLPGYITEKKWSADELIEKLEREFKEQEKKRTKKMYEELNIKKQGKKQ